MVKFEFQSEFSLQYIEPLCCSPPREPKLDANPGDWDQCFDKQAEY
jgi:hypothetical protein